MTTLLSFLYDPHARSLFLSLFISRLGLFIESICTFSGSIIRVFSVTYASDPHAIF